MLVDTSKCYEFKATHPAIVRDRLLNSFAVGLVALALSGAAIWAGPEWFSGMFDRRAALLYLCLAFGFPVVAGVVFWHGSADYRASRKHAGQVLVVVDEHGIWDKRLLRTALAWSSIRSIRLTGEAGSRNVEVAISDGHAADWADAGAGKRGHDRTSNLLEVMSAGLMPAFPSLDEVVLKFWKNMRGAAHAL